MTWLVLILLLAIAAGVALAASLTRWAEGRRRR